MKKRIVEALIVALFLACMLSQTVKGEQLHPKKLESQERANLSLTKAYKKTPTIEKHEIEIVEVSEEDLNEEEFCDGLEILALCVEAEAGNQDLMGKRLVVDVILNRVESDRFPDTIEDVISQKYHFSTYWNGVMAGIEEPSEDTFEAIRLELHERTDTQILFFTAGDYNTYCVPAYKYGAHYFGY